MVEISVQNNPAQFGIHIGPLGIRPVSDFEVPPAPLVAVVNFNSYIMGKNLIALVEDWEASLPKREVKFIQKLQKKSALIRQILTFVATLAAIYGSLTLVLVAPPEDFSDVAVTLIVAAGIVYLANFIGERLSRQVENEIDRVQNLSNISLTKGDMNGNEKLSSRNSRRLLSSVGYLAGVIVQILCGLMATQIWLWLSAS